MAFLSLLDDRARPKGSRDPLGFELVWTYFGRKVVGNLTTITSSWRIFAVGLLGFHWSNQLCRDIHPLEKQARLQQHFIRYEQLAAYLRSSAGDDEIMGINRVRKRLAEPGRTIRIGTDPQDLILSDQISYGIWGLYSTALRESGLVTGDFREPTERGLAIVKLMEDALENQWYWSFMRGAKGAVPVADLPGEGKRFVKAVTNPRVKEALIASLLAGSGSHQCQLALYGAAREIPKDVLARDDLGTAGFISEIQKRTASTELKRALTDITQVERLLVTANTLFDYCRRKDGERLEQIAKTVDQKYDFQFLPDGPDLNGCPYGADLAVLRTQLRQGEVASALRGLLALNKKIMDGRGGAAWVEEGSDGTLRVRMNAETAQLPEPDRLQAGWDYDYFLRSFARIAAMERA